MKVYLVIETPHPMDDPYYASPTTLGAYASMESAQAVVDAHIAECKAECAQRDIPEDEMWEYHAQLVVCEMEVQP